MKTFLPRQESDTKERSPGLSRGLLLMLLLPSDPTLLCVVRGAVERLTKAMGFSAVECRSVTRAVDEAMANIMQHSYSGRADQLIATYFRRAWRGSQGRIEDGLEVLLCDRGPAVDPVKLRGRALDDIRPGGLGLHFIRQAMDTVEFTRVGRTNRLRMVKYLLSAKPDLSS